MLKKRVLLLTTNLGTGGAERVFHDHAEAFSEFHYVEKVVFNLASDKQILESQVPIHDLVGLSLIAKLGPLGRLISRAVMLNRRVKQGGFDIVISHLDGANWVNVLSFSKAKKILVVHGSVLGDQGQSIIRKWFRVNVLTRLIYNRAFMTVAVSAGVTRELSNYCGVHNVQTINNFFDIKQILEQAKSPLSISESAIFNGGPVLLTSGRLSFGKNQLFLLKVIAELKKDNVNARLVILGDGEIRQLLLSEATRLNLNIYEASNVNQKITDGFDVYLMGYVANPFRYLAHASLFVFPSAWEGFPLSLCEAMICGVPVLSSDCPTGPREILAPETEKFIYNIREAEFVQNGVLLPTPENLSDLTVWSDAIKAVIEDPGLRVSLAKCAAESIQVFDKKSIIYKWLELIDSISEEATTVSEHYCDGLPNVLMIIPELGYGGAAQSFCKIAHELAKFYNLTFVIFQKDLNDFASCELDGGVNYLEVSGGKSLHFKLARFLYRIRLVKKIKREKRIQVSISFLEGADYLNILSRINDKLIISIRGSKSYDGNITGLLGWVRKKFLIPFLYCKVDRILCVNSGIVSELRDDFQLANVPAKVVYNFYDIDNLLTRSSEPIPTYFVKILSEPYLIIASRLAREKNILPLVHVFAALKRMGLKHRLLIVGDGPELIKIEGLCHSLGLAVAVQQQENLEGVDVICVGAVSNPHKYIKSASAFIMASESEGFPNSLVEAMVLSVPVISSDCPWGPREILQPDSSVHVTYASYPYKAKFGVLMPMLSARASDVEEWATGLYSVLVDESLLRSYRDKSKVAVERYSKETIVNEWTSCIDELISARCAP